MLRLILIDVQYLQDAVFVFGFEKGSNGSIHSFRLPPPNKKIPRPEKFPIPSHWGE